MSKAPGMPMYWDAYLADTTHLTTEEHGAYLLLLAAMWRRNGSVPDDDRDNARILGLTLGKWRKIKARLTETVSGFVIENDAISQEKLQKTWKNTQEKISKNRTNGAKGGRAAASKNNDLGQANAAISQERIYSIPEPEPEPDIYDTKVSLVNQVKADCEIAVSAWNQAAGQNGWPKVQRLTAARSKQLAGRIKDAGGLDGWQAALQKAGESDFLCGRSGAWNGFCFDWMTKAANFTKLMEGNYGNRNDNITAINGAGQRGGNAGQGAYERERLRGIAAGIGNPKGY